MSDPRYKKPMTRTKAQKEQEANQEKHKEHRQTFKRLTKYIKCGAFQTISDEMANEKEKEKEKKQKLDYFCENSLVVMEDDKMVTVYMPAYIRCHFRNMTEMDIQNLSCRFIATMNLSFLLATYKQSKKKEQNKKDKNQNREGKEQEIEQESESESEPEQKQIQQQDQIKEKRAKAFAEMMAKHLKQKLKVTFQNDFVMNIQDELSTNVSDSDRTIRQDMTDYECNGIRYIYQNFIVTREFKFGLRSDILFFPLEQNDLNMVTTLHPIKVPMEEKKDKNNQEKKGPKDGKKQLMIHFNCMNIELPYKQDPLKEKNGQKQKAQAVGKLGNVQLEGILDDLYMHENDGKQLTDEIKLKEFQFNQQNNPFFRNVKLSFPQRSNCTEFGYYNLVEKEIKIYYTQQKQPQIKETFYEKAKNCLFCRKKISNYKDHPEIIKYIGYQPIDQEEKSLENSFCNVIMQIPMLKASLGTIIQLCIPIFFLAFLGLVEFLYSQSTSGDQVRGQKIGSSTLIVATYISFIYSMRTVIPPTPSWSIFQVAVCILAACTMLPIIQSIYSGNYQSTENPFLNDNGLFIAAFLVNAFLCLLIVTMLILVKAYMLKATQRIKLQNVSMSNLIENLTKKYFFVWRNLTCKVFMIKTINSFFDKNKNKKQKNKYKVRFQKWRQPIPDKKEEAEEQKKKPQENNKN